MVMTNTERVKKSFAKYARPAILIDKNKNDMYKTMVKNKGYDSLNDYINSILKYDSITDRIPYKADIIDMINTEDKNSPVPDTE